MSGNPKEPSFSISADQVMRDEDKCEIVYQNATIRLKGVPVFYTPYFAHPDPSVDEASRPSGAGSSAQTKHAWGVLDRTALPVGP